MKTFRKILFLIRTSNFLICAHFPIFQTIESGAITQARFFQPIRFVTDTPRLLMYKLVILFIYLGTFCQYSTYDGGGGVLLFI